MSRDFLTSRVKTNKIIADGSNTKLVIHSSSDSTNSTGDLSTGFSNKLTGLGSDVFMYVSGTINGKANNNANSVSVFGGDLVVSGTLYAEKQIIEIEQNSPSSISVSGSIVHTTGINIGPPEDSTYTDGLFSDFTNSTNVGVAIDRFNEVLKALAPSPAPALDQFSVTTSNGTSAKLSFGSSNNQSSANPSYLSVSSIGGYNAVDINTVYGDAAEINNNYKLGIYQKNQTITGILNDDVTSSVYTNSTVNYPDNSFGSADQGTLKLFLNGSEIHSVNLSLSNSTCGYHNTTSITIDNTSALKVGMEVSGTNIPDGATINSITNSTTFVISASATSTDAVTNQTLNFILGSGDDLNGNSSGFKNLSLATPGKFASDTDFDTFKYRTGSWQISSTDQVNGLNYVQVKHVIDSSNTKTTGFAQWVNDDNSDALSLTSKSLSFTGSGNRTLSGVKYFTGGSFTYNANVDNVYKYVYSTNQVTFNVPSSLLTLSNFDIPQITSPETHTKTLVISKSGNISLPSSNRVLDGSVTAGCTVPHPLKSNLTGSGTEETAAQILIDANPTNGSSITSESFDDEQFRMKENNYNNQSDVSSSNIWLTTESIDSSNTGYSESLMCYNSKLISPASNTLPNSGNFSTMTNGPTLNVNYSSSNIKAGEKYYYRKIQNTTGQSIRDLSYTASGSATVITHGANHNGGNNNIKVYFRLPGSTNWLDSSSLYVYHSVNSEGDGCNATTPNNTITSNVTNNITFGTTELPNSEFIMMKVHAKKTWTGNLDSLQFNLGLTNSNAVTSSPILQSINANSGVTGKLSFGASNTISSYNNVGTTVNSGNNNTNDLFQLDASSNRYGIFNNATDINGNLNFNQSGSGSNYDNMAWGGDLGNKGTIQLELNGNLMGTAINLTNSSAQSDNYLNVGQAKVGENTSSIPDHRKYYRTGSYTIPAADQSLGWNYARVIHNDGNTNRITNYIEWVNSSSNTITFGTTSVNPATIIADNTTSNYLSGIYYFKSARGQINFTAANVYKNVYSELSDAISFPNPTNALVNGILVGGNGVVNSSSNSPSRSLPDLDTSFTNAHDEDISITATYYYQNEEISLPGNLLNTQIRCKIKHPLHGEVTSNYFTPLSPLCYTVNDTETDSIDNFSAESYRLQSVSYANQTGITSGSNDWDSSVSLIGSNNGHNTGLQVYNNKLVAPNIDFRNHNASATPPVNTNLQGPQNNPNYSTASGIRTFYRKFQNLTGASKSNFTIKLNGTGSNIVSSGTSISGSTSNIHVKVKLAQTGSTANTSTAIADFASSYTSDSALLSNGGGCLDGNLISNINSTATESPISNDGTLGGIFVPNGSYIIVIIEASSSWTGYLNQIKFEWR